MDRVPAAVLDASALLAWLRTEPGESIVQHALGIISGLLLFDVVRRSGVPRAWGLIPAAVVMLGGAELLLEHTILSDPLFIFLVTLGLWLCVLTWTRSLWFALLAGIDRVQDPRGARRNPPV